MENITIGDITRYLETIAPPSLQESYDNSGLITGQTNWACTGALVTLDSTEAVIDEAIAEGCNLVIAHHPIIFSGLKKLNGKNYIERTIIKAIKNDVAIYAIHTNLDNVSLGVNKEIADRIGLVKPQILSHKENTLRKLVVFAPQANADALRDAIFSAGAGHIGQYSHCSFNTPGQGTFMGEEGSNPHMGEVGKLHTEDEIRIESILPAYLEEKVVNAMLAAHPYEEVAYDIYLPDNKSNNIGSGMVGELENPVNELDFLNQLKQTFNCGVVKYTALLNKPVKKVAVCGGSGRFLLNDAIRAGADVFVTSDFKYHDYFDADNRIVVADIGHYESEQFTKQLLHTLLIKKFTTFAVRVSKTGTNPVNYL